MRNKLLKQTIFDLLEYRGWYGTDMNIQISLLEYGLLVRETIEDVQIIFTSERADTYLPRAYCFDTVSKKGIDAFFENNNWAERTGFLDFFGMDSIEEWSRNTYANKIDDLLAYYGWDNVIGDHMYYTHMTLLQAANTADGLYHKSPMQRVPGDFTIRWIDTEKGWYAAVITKITDKLYSGIVPNVVEIPQVESNDPQKVAKGLKRLVELRENVKQVEES